MTGNVEWGQGVGYTMTFGDDQTTTTTRLVGIPFCPDLLSYDSLGEADNLRGRVVRAFFWCIRWWKP